MPQGSVLSPLLFLIYVNDLPTPHHKQNSLSQFADDTAQWAFSLNIHIAAKLLQQDLLKLAMWCAKWRVRLNLDKTKVIIFSRSILARKTELNLKLYGETLKIYPQGKFLGITFDSQVTLKNSLRHPGLLQYQVPPFKDISQQKVGTKLIHTNPNLQTMHPTNFLIWLSFDRYCLGQCYQQNSAASK